MQKIFLDLEFCNASGQADRKKGVKPEIIEIGAVRLDGENNVTDDFEMLVKPETALINRQVSDLTHITNEQVAGAVGFARAMDSFLAWVGEEETEVYSWSMADYEQMKGESSRKGYCDARLEKLFGRWNDFQKEFSSLLNIDKYMSLENAVAAAGLKFRGQPHRALSDAASTADLYIFTQDKELFKKQMASLIEWLQPTPSLTISLGSFISADIYNQLSCS